VFRQSRNSTEDIWGQRTPYAGEGCWPVRVDECWDEEPERWVQSACVLCANGCGLDIGIKDNRIVGVRGRAVDRVNRGRLGPKGMYGWRANHSPDRLTRPLIRAGEKFREASWDEAMGLIVRRAREVREKYSSGALGFYNTGQFFLEEYYTLSLIAHAGLGTNHLDGNTRLCTATASVAMRETFGTDGQACSYADVDDTDCLFLIGSDMALTKTVLWMRLLDRRHGPRPPHLVVVDPRSTATAREADIHLAPRVGTNVAVLNGLLNLVIQNGGVDHAFVERHTVGYEKLEQIVRAYPPEHVREITGIPIEKLHAAADMLTAAPTLVSVVLQGVYQSNQASAAACQVNNLNLIRGLVGKPGCGIFQMNGQPTSQNTRECGCDGEFPLGLNPMNAAHVRELARRWNVDPLIIPHWHTHAHALEIFRHAETGSIKLLWIMATNPAVSLPELHRIRKILRTDGLFVVVQDAFMTETARLADVVLPAAIWGEKTGTFTNADRTVHISHKAVDPPGEARADLDILLDFVRRMDFRDKDGQPLVKWSDAEGAFNHWKEATRGLFIDYSGLTYDRLSAGSGIPWPCNEAHPDGCERIYTDFVFRTASDVCETYGHDLETGASIGEEEYRANDPKGRAILKAANYIPPPEQPDEEYPFWLTTGRLVHHFHTRTKTGRCPELQQAAPKSFVQMAAADAELLGIREGDIVEVSSRRGTVRGPARLGDILTGHLFIPFHYGYWDERDPDHERAANELTRTAWDPVSKQPFYKMAAVQVRKAGAAHPSLGQRVVDMAAKVVDRTKELTDKVLSRAHESRSHVPDHLGLLAEANEAFIKACESVSAHHVEETEVRYVLSLLAGFSREAVEMLKPFRAKYGQRDSREPENLRKELFSSAHVGALELLRDLQNLFVLASEVQILLTTVLQASQALRDPALLTACHHLHGQNKRQLAWLDTQIRHRAPHTLTVPS
jgi:anaerobic selenocysteine-containing dehydrogenase